MAVIYILDTTNLNTDLSLYHHIPVRRLEKLQRSTNQNYIKESLGAQILLNDVLENRYLLDLEKIEYIYNPQGKPYLKDIPLYFSISHSNGIVCLMVAKDQEIGIDIEEIKQHKKNVALKIMNVNEYQIYQDIQSFGDEQNDYFYQIWCAKEAYVKKLGTSITFNPANIVLDEEVVIKKIKFKNKNFMLACCGVTTFTIVQKYLPKEFISKEKK